MGGSSACFFEVEEFTKASQTDELLIAATACGGTFVIRVTGLVDVNQQRKINCESVEMITVTDRAYKRVSVVGDDVFIDVFY